MPLNVSRIPFSEWCKFQQDTALKKYERVIDIKFNHYDTEIDEVNVKYITTEILNEEFKTFS